MSTMNFACILAEENYWGPYCSHFRSIYASQSWCYSLTLLENLCLHSETVWKFWWAVLRFSGWVGQTVSEYRRLGDIQFQIFLDKYSSLWGTVQWSEIPKWIGSSDIDFITHLQYDKLWGLPRRVFTLFIINWQLVEHISWVSTYHVKSRQGWRHLTANTNGSLREKKHFNQRKDLHWMVLPARQW